METPDERCLEVSATKVAYAFTARMEMHLRAYAGRIRSWLKHRDNHAICPVNTFESVHSALLLSNELP